MTLFQKKIEYKNYDIKARTTTDNLSLMDNITLDKNPFDPVKRQYKGVKPLGAMSKT